MTLRPYDVAFIGLLVLVARRLRSAAGRASGLPRSIALTGSLFVLAVVLSAAWVAVAHTNVLGAALPSAVRVVQLAVLAAAVAQLSRVAAHRALLLRWITYGALTVSTLYAIAHLVTTWPVELLGLQIGKGTVGPVAVASLVLAFASPGLSSWTRAALGAFASVNLLFAVSMTAYLSVILVVPALVWALVRLARRPLKVQLAAAVAAAVLCSSFAFTGLRLLRPEALPSRIAAPLTLEVDAEGRDGAAGRGDAAGAGGSEVVTPPRTAGVDAEEAIAGATILHRAILMTTAYEVFLRSPAAGAGWTRGDDPGVVDDRQIVADMKRRFPSGYDSLFTDVSPTGAHNAVLQVLAELGLFGGLPLLALLGAVALANRRRSWQRDDVAAARLKLVALALFVVSLSFLMFTGFYPGQVETLLAAVAIGLQSRAASP